VCVCVCVCGVLCVCSVVYVCMRVHVCVCVMCVCVYGITHDNTTYIPQSVVSAMTILLVQYQGYTNTCHISVLKVSCILVHIK